MTDKWRVRSELRSRFANADATIERYDREARDRKTPPAHFVPPMDATPEALSASSTAEITVSVEWLAYLLDDAWRSGRQSMRMDDLPNELAVAVETLARIWDTADSGAVMSTENTFGGELVRALMQVSSLVTELPRRKGSAS